MHYLLDAKIKPRGSVGSLACWWNCGALKEARWNQRFFLILCCLSILLFLTFNGIKNVWWMTRVLRENDLPILGRINRSRGTTRKIRRSSELKNLKVWGRWGNRNSKPNTKSSWQPCVIAKGTRMERRFVSLFSNKSEFGTSITESRAGSSLTFQPRTKEVRKWSTLWTTDRLKRPSRSSWKKY